MRRLSGKALGLAAAVPLLAAAASAEPGLRENPEAPADEPGHWSAEPPPLVSRGAELLDEGRYEEAIRELDLALAFDPESRARILRGRAWLELGEPTRALADARGHLRRSPDDPEGWLLVARAERAAGRPEEALAPFQEVFARVQATPELYLERAAAFREADDLEGAARGLEEGLSRLGPLPSLLAERLEIEDARGDLEGGLAVLRRLLDVSPRPEIWLVERARRLSGAGRFEAARNDLRAAAARLAAMSEERRREPVWLEAVAALRQVAAGLPGGEAIGATLVPAT